MLVDAHVHLNNYHETDAQPVQAQCHELFAKMAERGVDHAVVITSYKVDDARPGVEKVMDTLAGDPRTTIVEGLRWRGDDPTDLFAMEERIRARRVRGIKLYPGYEPYAIDDPSLEAVFRMAAKYQVPVLIHTGDTYAKAAKVRKAHPLLVDDVAVDHPETTFVMCHAGNPWFTDAAEVVYKNDNVYADISGLTLGAFEADFERLMLQRLAEMIRYLGAAERKLMFGTDWPLVRMGPYVDFLDRLALPAEQKECIAWKTAQQVFGIDLGYAEGRTDAADDKGSSSGASRATGASRQA